MNVALPLGIIGMLTSLRLDLPLDINGRLCSVSVNLPLGIIDMLSFEYGSSSWYQW